jgi:hypothetical protein
MILWMLCLQERAMPVLSLSKRPASVFKMGAIDTSIIHDTLAVIANEVKQSSKTKDTFCLKHLDCRVGFASSQ